MTGAEKQTAASFLDLAADYITCGYHCEQKRDYHFEDTPIQAAASAAVSTTAVETTPCDNGDSIEAIAAEVRACTNCSLGATRKNAVPGEGVLQPLVMVIGEGPGADEDAQGRPFVGRAGQLLDKMLASVKLFDSTELSRNTNCFIANVVKCRPPNNREPHIEESAACAHFLKRQITLLRPKFIVAAGRIAAQALLETTEPIGKLRGQLKELVVGDSTLPLLVTYHPAALLRNESLKRPAWEDLKFLRAKLEELHGQAEV